jgi:ubiquinone biosynthesis protein
VQAGKVLYELINISYSRGLRLPAELTLLAKALFNLDGVTRALDPLFNPMEAIREYANQLTAQRAKKDFSPRRLLQMASQGSEFLSMLPHRLEVITQRLATGDFETRVEVPQMQSLLGGLQKVANRIFSGLVIAALIVASAMLIDVQRTLGTIGFVIAAVIGLYMLVTIVLTDRRKEL